MVKNAHKQIGKNATRLMESSPNTFARKYARLRLGYEGNTRSLKYARADCASKVRGPGEATPHVSTDEAVQESGFMGDVTSKWSNAEGLMGDNGSWRECGARLRGGEAIHDQEPAGHSQKGPHWPLEGPRCMRKSSNSMQHVAEAIFLHQ